MPKPKKPKAELDEIDLRNLCEIIAEADGGDDDETVTKAVLALLTEIKGAADKTHGRTAVHDLCDDLIIYLYQKTQSCERASYEFAIRATAANLT